MAGAAVGPDGTLEFIIKRYPGGHFSGLLGGTLAAATSSTDRPVRLVHVAGQPGPAAGARRRRRRHGPDAGPVAPVGRGRQRAPYHLLLRGANRGRSVRAAELAELATALPQLSYVACLSQSWPDDWNEATTGFVHDVVGRHESELASCDVYLCGPPPMIDAALELLASHSVPQEQIHFDKFTVTAESVAG